VKTSSLTSKIIVCISHLIGMEGRNIWPEKQMRYPSFAFEALHSNGICEMHIMSVCMEIDGMERVHAGYLFLVACHK
jgi:hypothetical protein